MFFTRTVPAVVPSVFQSSIPLTPSSAAKKSVAPTAVRYFGEELYGEISLTFTVPAEVPSLFHSSTSPPSTKNSVPFTLVSLSGHPQVPGHRSLTITVPVAVPSLFHSSPPAAEVHA